MSGIWICVVLPAWLFGALRVYPTCEGGLLAVALSHGVAVAYEVRRYKKAHPTSRDVVHRVANHLTQPEGLALLVAYLVATWHGGLLPSTYYAPNRGVSFSRVALQLVVQDGLMYVAHRLQHGLKLRCHYAHHLFSHPTAFDSFHGSLADTCVMIIAPLFLTAHALNVANVNVNVYDYMAFGSIYANALFFLHSDSPHSWDAAFRRVGFGTQQEHHAHHARPNTHFGHLLTWWDHAALTF